MGMPGMGKKEEKIPAVKSDIKYIRCQVCEHLAKQARNVVKALQAELKPGKKVRTELEHYHGSPFHAVSDPSQC